MIEGGQGRNSRNIEDSAYAICWLALFGLVAVGFALLVAACS